MPQKISTGFRALVDAAEREIETLPVEKAIAQHGRDDVTFVDLRDVRELEREGRIPGAFHCPRGMLEFWIDPESPISQADLRGRQKLRVLLRRRLAFSARRANRAAHGPSSGRPYRRRFRRLAQSRRADRSAAAETEIVKRLPECAESTRALGLGLNHVRLQRRKIRQVGSTRQQSEHARVRRLRIECGRQGKAARFG